METFVVATAVSAFAAFIGYKVGYSKGVKVNAPAPAPRPVEPYDERKDRR